MLGLGIVITYSPNLFLWARMESVILLSFLPLTQFSAIQYTSITSRPSYYISFQ
jgi:hypothetical protein